MDYRKATDQQLMVIMRAEERATIRERAAEFDRINGTKSPYSKETHDQYTKWLFETVPPNGQQVMDI
ncbi:hypothetical protein D3C87_1595900 [compost metagenome]